MELGVELELDNIAPGNATAPQSPHVPTPSILNAVSFYFECYEIVYASITLCPDCWIVTEKVTNIKIRCKAQ